MGSFFIPRLREGAPATERAYRELRDQAEVHTGAVSRDRRIEGVMCRYSGHDCVLQVGEPDVGTGQLVAAIIQVGRSTYTVHHVGEDPSQPPAPRVLNQSDVYSVTDFQ
jgi:hypothetical protein